MKLTTKQCIVYTLGVLTLAGLLLFAYSSGLYTKLAGASASLFVNTACYTASATSTLTYMTPGTATTTLECFLGQDGAHKATLAIEVNASSTLTQYNFFVEESYDRLDWFPVTLSQTSTTTSPFDLVERNVLSVLFSSTTIGATELGASPNRIGADGSDNRNHYIADIPVRLRHVRVHA